MFFGNTLFKLFMEIEKHQRQQDFACDVTIKKLHDGDGLELEFIHYVGDHKLVLGRTLTNYELNRSKLSFSRYLDLFFDSARRQRQTYKDNLKEN